MLDMIKKIFSPGVLGKYKLEGVIYRHQFYTVRSARDRKTMRPVNVKEYSEEGLEVQRKFDRLYRTRPLAEILVTLGHPHLARTIEVEHSEGRLVEVIDALPGTSLRNVLDDRDTTPERFRGIVTQLAGALSYLHSHGLIHRGLAPEGIAVSSSGDVKIFDLSLMMDIAKAQAGGTVVGPVGYTAPEVVSRRNADASADVYSLGAIAYEMFCGMPLFPNARGYEGLLRMMNSKPVPLVERRCGVSAELDAVIMKAVERRSGDRYQSAEEFLDAFTATPLPKRTRKSSPANAA